VARSRVLRQALPGDAFGSPEFGILVVTVRLRARIRQHRKSRHRIALIGGINGQSRFRAGVEDLAPGVEEGHIGADRVHDTHGVRRVLVSHSRSDAFAHLVIDRIDRNRLHRYADVAAFRFGLGGFEIKQCLRIVKGKWLFSRGRPSCSSSPSENVALHYRAGAYLVSTVNFGI
jgi:hypothetical protein